MSRLRDLFAQIYEQLPESVTPISGSGSNRSYYRMKANGVSCIGVLGTDVDENRAFVSEAWRLHDAGFPVPEVIAVADDCSCYLQEDLGDTLLYDLVARAQKEGKWKKDLKYLLFEIMALLPRIQFDGAKVIDFDECYPEKEFNRRMVMFDLNYFKYCFLKPSGLEFNEVRLQDDLERMADELMAASQLYDKEGNPYEGDTFMYRDFQSRNVMVRNGQPYFIDFQGGRKGPVHYDVASFIWHARSGYPARLRDKMLDVYLSVLTEYVDVDRKVFKKVLRKFVLFRTLQVLGAYGFRGWMEQKAKFVTSIPAAIDSLREQLAETASADADFKDSYLYEVLSELVGLSRFKTVGSSDGRLTVTVYSFSFHKGIPHDPSGNGGGYVFDCRSIHNPGRYEAYKKLTGRNRAVIEFLENDGEVFSFLEHVQGVVDPHVETYSSRGFSSLTVSFGCTGGQHRSVYCAEHLARHLAGKYPDIHVRLIHREQKIDLHFEPQF